MQMLKVVISFVFDFAVSPFKETYRYLFNKIDDNNAVEALKYLNSIFIIYLFFFDMIYPDKYLETGLKDQLSQLKKEKLQVDDIDATIVNLVNIYFDIVKFREYFIIFLCLVIAGIYSYFYQRNFNIRFDDSGNEKRSFPVVIACYSFGTFQVMIPLLINLLLYVIPAFSSQSRIILTVVLAFVLSGLQLLKIKSFLRIKTKKELICIYFCLILFSLILTVGPSYFFNSLRDIYILCSVIDCRKYFSF